MLSLSCRSRSALDSAAPFRHLRSRLRAALRSYSIAEIGGFAVLVGRPMANSCEPLRLCRVIALTHTRVPRGPGEDRPRSHLMVRSYWCVAGIVREIADYLPFIGRRLTADHHGWSGQEKVTEICLGSQAKMATTLFFEIAATAKHCFSRSAVRTVACVEQRSAFSAAHRPAKSYKPSSGSYPGTSCISPAPNVVVI
jgi:hypothetical protein